MNFSSKVDRIIKTLDCTNARLARISGIDPSLVSRFRTGMRNPRPESRQFLLFCKGIVSCAVEDGLWDALRSSCQLSEAVCPEDAVRDYLKHKSPAAPTHEASGRTVTENANMFGAKLSCVMNILDISNIRLARALNVDTSLVSRFRNGLRVPPKSGQLMYSLCLYLHKVIKAKDSDAETDRLTLLTGANPGLSERDFTYYMSSWLSDSGEVHNTGVMDSFLEKLDSLVCTISPETAVPFSVSAEDYMDKDYYGTEGIRAAAVRFLSAVISSKAGEMKLYSDQNLHWMTADQAFTQKWRLLMYSALKNQTRIKIIHNVDRSVPEMLSGIEKWLPLYMSGGVEGYYSRQAAGDRFSHTLFVCPGTAAVSAFIAVGGEDKAEYLYTDKPDRITASDTQFELLLEGSKPLLQVYKSGVAGEYELFLSELASHHGKIKRLMFSPPVYALPVPLLVKMLERNGAEKDETEKVLSAHALLWGRFIGRGENASVTDFIYFPDIEDIVSGKVKLNLSDVMSDRIITYGLDDYREHIRALIPLLDSGSYSVIPLPESPFSNIQITIKEGFGAVVQKTDPPVTVFRFGHPLMCKALSEYIDVIGQSGKSGSCEKSGLVGFLINRYRL